MDEGKGLSVLDSEGRKLLQLRLLSCLREQSGLAVDFVRSLLRRRRPRMPFSSLLSSLLSSLSSPYCAPEAGFGTERRLESGLPRNGDGFCRLAECAACSGCCFDVVFDVRRSTAPLVANSIGGWRAFPLTRQQRVARCVIIDAVAVTIAIAIAAAGAFERRKFAFLLLDRTDALAMTYTHPACSLSSLSVTAADVL